MVATAAPPRRYGNDALGRRVEKVITGATYRYIYSGVETVSVYTSTGTWKQDYVYGPGIDEVLMLEQADVLDWDGDSNTSELARSWYRANALGSIMRIEEPDKTEAVSYRYDPYGEVAITRGGSAQGSDPLGQYVTYTGRWRDEETGLYHYRARAYDSVRGRFLQRDPLGVAAGPSLYEYVRSRPAMLRDPSGRSPAEGVTKVANRAEAKQAVATAKDIPQHLKDKAAETLSKGENTEDPWDDPWGICICEFDCKMRCWVRPRQANEKGKDFKVVAGRVCTVRCWIFWWGPDAEVFDHEWGHLEIAHAGAKEANERDGGTVVKDFDKEAKAKEDAQKREAEAQKSDKGEQGAENAADKEKESRDEQYDAAEYGGPDGKDPRKDLPPDERDKLYRKLGAEGHGKDEKGPPPK